jgi:uncharacterized protein (TIGR02284 family)
MDTTVLDHLKSLHTGAIDARNGYEEALKDAEGHGLTPLFREMISLHAQNASELGSQLASAGEQPDNDGSFMSTIHRTIMSIRGLFGGLGESVLPGLIDGEKRNINAYDEALKLPNEPAEVQSILSRQRDRLQTALTKMQRERATA